MGIPLKRHLAFRCWKFALRQIVIADAEASTGLIKNLMVSKSSSSPLKWGSKRKTWTCETMAPTRTVWKMIAVLKWFAIGFISMLVLGGWMDKFLTLFVLFSNFGSFRNWIAISNSLVGIRFLGQMKTGGQSHLVEVGQPQWHFSHRVIKLQSTESCI